MVVRRVHLRAAERPGGAGVHGHVGGAADGGQHGAGVLGAAGQRGVAVHGGDADELQRRVMGGEEDGEGILAGAGWFSGEPFLGAGGCGSLRRDLPGGLAGAGEGGKG